MPALDRPDWKLLREQAVDVAHRPAAFEPNRLLGAILRGLAPLAGLLALYWLDQSPAAYQRALEAGLLAGGLLAVLLALSLADWA